MEISSITGSANLGGTTAQALDKEQNMDAFSQLLAILFGNMLIPNTNQYSLMMNQANMADSANTSRSSIELPQMLSAINSLRIGMNQFNNTETTQSLQAGNSLLSSVFGNNAEFEKLFNLSDGVPGELQEFINNINSLSSKGSENIAAVINSETVNIIKGQLEKDIKISELLNTQTGENTAESDALTTQLLDNSEIMKLKQAAENGKSPSSIANTPNNSTVINYSDSVNDIKSSTEANEDGINSSDNTQSQAKSIKPQEKTSNTPELTHNLNQGLKVSNLNDDSINLQQNVSASSLIEKPQDLIELTVEKFKTLRLPGSTEVTVKLKPEELGEVTLKLVLEKGQINGSITAERKEIVMMLQNNLEQLKTELKNSNVNLNNLSVNIQSGEEFDRDNSRRGFSNRQNKNNHRTLQAFEDDIQSYDMIEGFNIIA